MRSGLAVSRVLFLALVLPVAACGGGGGGGGSGGIGGSGGSGSGGSGGSGPAPMLTACPTSGEGAVVADAACFTFTPADAGADPGGVNATVDQYALEPAAPAAGALVVMLNGSLGSPAGTIADPTRNFFNAAAASGFHVIGLAYRSDDVIGSLCAGHPACFAPTRQTVVLGAYQSGAAAALANMRADEGIVARLDAALRRLAAARPDAGWSQFLASPAAADPSHDVDWSRVIAAGHSQGGGMAAYLGLLFPLRRVVQLSSTCDAVARTPAPWTAASSPWATPPASAFVGFAAPTTFDAGGAPIGGDTSCPYHLAVWQNMGMAAANQHDDAAVCGLTGDTHSASIRCADNYERWLTLFQ